MIFNIQQLSEDSRFNHVLRFEVLEQLYLLELGSVLLSMFNAWEAHERGLNQLLLVYYSIALSLFCRLTPFGGSGLPDVWTPLALGKPLPAPADGSGVGVSPSATGLPHHAPPLLASMPSDGTLSEVPEMLTNARHFGRLSSDKNQSLFHQVRCLYLAEVALMRPSMLCLPRIESQNSASSCLKNRVISFREKTSDRPIGPRDYEKSDCISNFNEQL